VGDRQQATARKAGTMKSEIIKVTWKETYKAQMGSQRFTDTGSRTFRRRADADRLVADLNDPGRLSFYDGREPRIEELTVTTEVVTH